MSHDAIAAFRRQVNDDAALHPAFSDALAQGPEALSALAREHGYDVSADEARDAVAQGADGRELTDYELELVAGGGDTGAQISGGTISRAKNG